MITVSVNLKLLAYAKTWVFDGKIVLTDPPTCFREDAVFPICSENIFLSKNLAVKEGDVVLDVGTGSGVLAIAAAEEAKIVFAVDINPRAIEYARTNVAVNGIGEKIRFIQSDFFSALKKNRFDVIIANPPFEPVPRGYRYFIHSNGGPNGNDVVEEICGKVADYLTSNGVFQMIVFSPSPNKERWSRYLERDFHSIVYERIHILDRSEYRKYLSKTLSEFNGKSISGFWKPADMVYCWHIKARKGG